MARDGSGTYSIPNTFLPNTVMSATAVNGNFTDVGTAITGSLARDGQSSMTGQLKAAAGTVGAPGIGFGVDPDTGFRRASEDEMRWVTGGVDRFYIDSTGKAFQLGDMDIAGNIGLTAPIVIATTSASLLTLRRTENDTTPRIVEEWHSGSGAGAKATLEVVGDGNNAVQTVRWRVNTASVFNLTQTLFTADVPLAIGSNLRFGTTGYLDFTEIAAPSAPASNVARLYAADVSGVTKLQFKDAAGGVTTIPPGADLQIFTSSGTWNKPGTGVVAFIQCWGAGGSGGRGGAGDGGGGGGGGGYVERWIALASVSAAVSVTIGAGGASQTSDNSNGSTGAASIFGSYASAAGGGAGSGTAADNGGGGGGGLGSAPENFGAAASGGTGGTGGQPGGTIGGVSTNAANNANPFGGGGGASTGLAGGGAIYGGGGGGAGESNVGGGNQGGSSTFGGGGGGGGADNTSASAGGTAVTYKGDGGAGAFAATNATAGTAPGGGGGGSESGNSGAGARGEVRVTVW